ncbi:hypothetical protein NDU88_001968 [Pleurodeles waltl]|uniref:Uncharacterized protein n=1 Tax=Pleurodeles waltl TaxID=8319 RepID=A0AAV7R8M7_PLEWA|nr:hypothetical protein NDU88_001968 [Pleurodeles waltl]
MCLRAPLYIERALCAGRGPSRVVVFLLRALHPGLRNISRIFGQQSGFWVDGVLPLRLFTLFVLEQRVK